MMFLSVMIINLCFESYRQVVHTVFVLKGQVLVNKLVKSTVINI